MSRRSPAASLQDIVEAIRRIRLYTTDLDIVWNIVDQELSPLLEGIQKALEKISA
jgi:uncharacterized protein with HEPN domain